MNIPSNILTLIAGVFLTLISLWYGQNHGLMPVAASTEATEVDELFNFMMTIATGLFLLVEGILIFMVLKFRRRPGDTTDGPSMEGNVPLEIFWTAIPTVIVFILAVYSFEIYNKMGGLDPMASHDHPPAQIAMAGDDRHIGLGIGPAPGQEGETPLLVDVNGIQYAWIFTYSDTGIVSGELHVPVNRLVQLRMKAGDVLHAFWLPEFRIKQDVIPGRDTELTFTPKVVGNYPIICAELCGAYHGGMKSQLYVQTETEYNQWVQENLIAQAEQPKANLAVNPHEQTAGEFLAPYAQSLGVTESLLSQVHAAHLAQ